MIAGIVIGVIVVALVVGTLLATRWGYCDVRLGVQDQAEAGR
jgi:hypothetical protein